MEKISYVQFIYYYTQIHALHFQFVCVLTDNPEYRTFVIIFTV